VGSGGLLLGAALTYVGLVDPHRPGSAFPGCPFKLLTGWNCPACGGLRMAHDLLHADLSAAVVDNVFLLVEAAQFGVLDVAEDAAGAAGVRPGYGDRIGRADRRMDRGAQPAGLPADTDNSRRVAGSSR
jgi:hypothetical protein